MIRKQIGNHSQTRQPQSARDLGSHDTAAVADHVHKAGTEEINQQLRQEKRRGDQGDLPQRNMVVRMEF